MEYSVVLLAAGRGTRTGLNYNKAFYILPDGKSVLQHSIDLFDADVECSQIVIVCAKEEVDLVKEHLSSDKAECVTGGKSRQDSVSHGLQKVQSDYVFIHDAARPYLKAERIADMKKTLEDYDACLLAAPSVDTVKIVNDKLEVIDTPVRANVWNAQTPQAFASSLLKEVHEQAAKEGYQGTDDVSLVEKFSSKPVKIVPGDSSNIKITNPEDVRH